MRSALEALVRLTRAKWASVHRRGERLEVPRPMRELDAGLLRSIERGRLVRIPSKTLRCWPRTAGRDLSEVLAYVDPERPTDRVVVGLRRPLAADPEGVEGLARLLLQGFSDESPPRTPRIDGLRAACATHDLRHLLTVASLELERARSGGGDEALERAERALGEARSMCERSLAPSEPTERDLIAIRGALESATRDASLASGRAARVEVLVESPADLAARVPRELLERALRNLVLNAIEATPDGKRVRVAASVHAGGEIRISVRDEGRGIAAEDLEDLLSPGRSGSGGSGFGTASVRACVRDLGGTLQVRTRPLAGTEFLLRLPRRP